MSPAIKATVITISVLMSIIVVPVLLVILHEYFYITVIAVVYSAFLYLFFTSMYELIRNEMLEELLDDEHATAAFHNDPLKIHYYRAFKKHFKGGLSLDGLEHYLEKHRPPY